MARKSISEADLKRMLSNSAVKDINSHILEAVPVKKKKAGKIKVEKLSEEKAWLKFNLHYFCLENKLTLKTEFKFSPDRLWRFDFFIEELKLGIEYEGIFSDKSRHTTAKGFTGDTEKYNAAQKLGYKVNRYTAINYQTVLMDLRDLMKEKGIEILL